MTEKFDAAKAAAHYLDIYEEQGRIIAAELQTPLEAAMLEAQKLLEEKENEEAERAAKALSRMRIKKTIRRR